MKAAVVDTGRSGRLRAELKTPRTPTVALDCPDQLQLYLNHLTALVPTAPKHRRLSKLEVIQCVIDYICDLEDTLLGRYQSAEEPAEEEERCEGTDGRRSTAAEDRRERPEETNAVRTNQVSRWEGMCLFVYLHWRSRKVAISSARHERPSYLQGTGFNTWPLR